MLTKQEREATIERVKSYGDSDLPFYKLLFGSRAPYAMQYTEYLKALKDRIIDLCDTSNMIELPLDKDGEVIQVGDTLYDDEGIEIKVCGFLLREADGKILLDINANNGFVVMSANELTHKKPVAIASIIEQLRRVINKGYISAWSKDKLCDIADKLEKLGDSDD